MYLLKKSVAEENIESIKMFVIWNLIILFANKSVDTDIYICLFGSFENWVFNSCTFRKKSNRKYKL